MIYSSPISVIIGTIVLKFFRVQRKVSGWAVGCSESICLSGYDSRRAETYRFMSSWLRRLNVSPCAARRYEKPQSGFSKKFFSLPFLSRKGRRKEREAKRKNRKQKEREKKQKERKREEEKFFKKRAGFYIAILRKFPYNKGADDYGVRKRRCLCLSEPVQQYDTTS